MIVKDLKVQHQLVLYMEGEGFKRVNSRKQQIKQINLEKLKFEKLVFNFPVPGAHEQQNQSAEG